MNKNTDILAREKAFLRENHDALATDYPDRFLVIRDQEVLRDFGSRKEAVNSVHALGEGPFMVRHVDQLEDRPVAHIPILGL